MTPQLLYLALVVGLAICVSGCKPTKSSRVVLDQADLDQVLVSQRRAQNAFLTAADVNEITRRAAEAVGDTTMVIAVVDREGQVLAVFRKPNAPLMVTGNFGRAVDTNDFAISLARTGAFFS